MRCIHCVLPLLELIAMPIEDETAFEVLRQRCIDRIDTVRQRFHEAGIASQWRELALFAVIARVDEHVTLSAWKGAAQWARNPLQREVSGTWKSGQEFYERLAWLEGQHDVPEASEVLEVFFACLRLGFQGAYHAGDGHDRRQRIMDELENRFHLHDEQEIVQVPSLPERLAPREPPPARPNFIPIIALFLLGFLALSFVATRLHAHHFAVDAIRLLGSA